MDLLKSHEITPVLEKAIIGDKDAICLLCEKIAKGVLFRCKYIMAYKGRQQDAEDITQEVLLRVSEKIHTLREPAAFWGWLATIISNEVKQFIIKNAKRGITVDINDYEALLEDDSKLSSPESVVEEKEISSAVYKIILTLPLRQREAVMYHYYDELSVTDVAKSMDISHQNVSKYLMRARERIKYELEREDGLVASGGMIASALGQEYASFAAPNTVWLQNVIELCKDHIYESAVTVLPVAIAAVTAETATATTTAATATSTAAATTTTGVVSTIIISCTTLVLVGAICAGIVLTIMSGDYQEFMVDGDIVFYESRVNPTNATPQVTSNRGELTAVSWAIAVAYDEIILFESDDNSLEDVLSQMSASGYLGEHILHFWMECELGAIVRISGNFYITEFLYD